MTAREPQPDQMGVELRVLFDGPEYGLPEHRLSVSTFGLPLANLLAAVQRTASAIIASATGNPEYGSRGGKFASDAKLLDLELVQVHEGCAEPRFVVTTAPGRTRQLTLTVDDLAAQTVERLVRDIEKEAHGAARNAAARKFLKSLPPGLTRQRYTATVNGVDVYKAEFGTAVLTETPPEMGQLLRKRVRVVGIGFEPTTITVRFGSRQLHLHASSEQIETALSLRHEEEVLAAFVDDGKLSRMIWLRSVNARVAPTPLENTVRHLKESWAETLRILGS